MSTFSYTPEFGASKQIKPSVSVIKFGDGYENRIAKGLNTILEVWTLTFQNRDQTEADAIDTFLRTQAAVTAFDWTPPGASTSRRFVCREWSRSVNKANLFTINATFEEVATF